MSNEEARKELAEWVGLGKQLLKEATIEHLHYPDEWDIGDEQAIQIAETLNAIIKLLDELELVEYEQAE